MGASGTILFLCPHNAAKSLLAVADFEWLAAARGLPFRADSAGTEPDERPSPAVVAALRAEGIDIADLRPRSVTATDVANAHRIISMGCALDELPFTTAQIEQWDDIPPVSQDLEVARKAIQRHLAALVDELAAENARVLRPPR